MKMLVMNRKIILSILVMAVLIYGLPGVSYGEDAVTGEITECSGIRQAWPLENMVDVTIQGTVRATRNVTNLRIEGKANGSFVGFDFLGDLSAGQSQNFSLTGSIFTAANSLNCGVELNWLEVTQPDPLATDPTPGGQDEPDTQQPAGTTRYSVGERILTLPTGVWTPDLTSGGSFAIRGGQVTIELRNGGLIKEDGITYTCVAAEGCTIQDRRVMRGTIQTTGGDTSQQPSPQPDLVIQSFQLNEVTLSPGESFTLSATVRNDGEGRASSTTLRYYRSPDSTISSSDTEVGTDRVSALEANRTSEESIQLTAPSSPGTYYYGVCVDDVSSESSTRNNCSRSVRITVAAPSDLVVGSLEVSNNTLMPGESFTLSATVRNRGTDQAPNTILRYYRSSDAEISTSDTQVDIDRVGVLSANGSADESLTLLAPTTPGTYYYGVCVDSVPNENNTDNNCSTAVKITVQQATKPDLGVKALTASTAEPLTAETLDGSVVTLTLSGKTFSPPLGWRLRDNRVDTGIVGVQVSGIPGLTIPSTWVPSNVFINGIQYSAKRYAIERISNTELEVELAFSGTLSSDATITFTVQAEAIRDYEGPAFTVEIPVTVETGDTQDRKPDFVVEAVQAVPATVAPGETFRLYATLKNQGTAESAATTVRYYRSTDNVISTADTQLKSANRDPLTADGTIRRYLSVTAPTTPGTYYYGVCVDSVTDESDTANNCSIAVSLTVTEPPVVAEDVNADGVVDVQDLVVVAQRYGQTGNNRADVNGDGIVNIDDLILVAAVLDADAAAAPSLYADALAGLTVADIKVWLSQSRQRDLTDPSVRRGIQFLEGLLASMVPKETALLANYPNPFNPETWIPYQLSKPADVTLTIYAIDGQVVRQLALGHQPAGIYQNRSRAAYWDGRNALGEPVASGVYFYTLTAGDFTATRKMLIRK